jgi:upstream activation factor subunit UAF30
MEKHWAKELKVAQKASSKKKRKTGNRAPSGFVKPTRISDELAKFLDKPSGTEMARTDVTRNINVYIRAHNLQDKDNGRKINPDSKLQSLLKLKKTDELTYFNLQRYMSPHFAKTIPAVAPVVASA